MMSLSKTTSLMLASGLATLALLQPAMALDAETFVNRIETVYKVMGYDFSFGPAILDGDTITVDGGTLGIVGMGDEPMKFDTTLTFSGVAETEDGGFTADSLTIPDIDTDFSADPVGHLSLTDIRVENIVLPPEGVTGSAALMQTAGVVATGPLSVTRDGAEVISIDSMDMTSEFTHDAAGALESLVTTTSIAGLWADLSTVKDEEPDAGAMIEALGLTEINGDFNQTMTWSMGDGHLVLEESKLDLADAGAIDFKLDVLGFTPAILDKIYAMQGEGLDATSEEAQAKQMMVGMELLQALSISSASIRYDDASLAGKLLDVLAAQSGTDRAAFVEGLKATLPGMVAQSGIPALTDLVVPPVSAFLDDPQSLEISVKPPQPTSLLVLTAAASNPAGLISAIGLAVTANQ